MAGASGMGGSHAHSPIDIGWSIRTGPSRPATSHPRCRPRRRYVDPKSHECGKRATRLEYLCGKGPNPNDIIANALG
jgi:hypothetical protein